MFTFLHGYLPEVWEAQVKEGIVGENDGIRFCQNIMLKDELKFNNLAAKDSELYNILKERKCPFYIDRLQGGVYIDEYEYDEELLKEYKELLGDNFWGFQMHEWMTNYRYDACGKLEELPAEDWTEEKIEKFIFDKFPYPYIFLEACTAKEMAEGGKPEDFRKFYENITNIYKKRLQKYELIPADATLLGFGFEATQGVKRFMPEVGAQCPDSRMQICYARGMSRAEGRSFGVYYEPWGGSPFSACCYHKEGKNEWGIGESADFPFETSGENGGSSRSLQKRVFLYGFLSGAEFMSEEWGLCNVFYDWENFELSPYGQTKKEFLDFTRKYTDIGDKLTPIAMVLPKELMVLDNYFRNDENYKIREKLYCGFHVDSPELEKVKNGVYEVFTSSLPMIGTEVNNLKNSDYPDAVELLNSDETVIDRYDWLIDLTCDKEFAEKHNNLCEIKDIKEKLKELLPCYVEGNCHWLVNECISGGYYLTVFNHSGIERTVANGEVALPEAETTVTVELKNGRMPTLLEGNSTLKTENGAYKLTIPAGDWAFIKF